jgi:hypothetical protein
MFKNIMGTEHKEYNTPIDRFTQISDWAIDTFKETHLIHHLKSFHRRLFIWIKRTSGISIAENCGILKYRLQQFGIDLMR